MKNVLLAISLAFFGTSLFGQTVPNPTQTDEIIIDNGQPGKADPADRIRYKVTIQNTAGPDATGTQLNIVPDPRTTFVSGSFRSSPLALPDAYAVTGNVPIMVSAASGLKANDFDDNLALATITAGTFATAGGGSITVNADGSFTYTPPAGFTGSDTYVYTLNDGNGVGGPVPSTDMATVTFTVSNLIWFIDNSAGAGDGRRNAPFNSLAAFNAGTAAAGDVVYVEHTGTDYTNGIVLANNERLFGEGHTGAANLSGVLPFALAANSVALPAINGTRPVITNGAGDGILLAQNNTVRGLNVGNSSDFAIDDNGNVGTLTISEVNINTTGGGFRTDNGGTLAVTLGALTSGGGASGIHLSSTGGSFTVTGATSISNSTGSALLIDGTSSGASTNFAAITVGNTGSHSIQLINNTGTFSASGTTTINSPAAGANISLNISGGGGAITFAAIDINGRRDKGIRISAGNRNITTGALDIDNPNTSTAIGLEILSPTGGTISFGATTINNNAAAGSAVEIQSSAAAITFASGSAVSNSGSHEFFVNGGNGNITYNGTLNSTAGACLAVNGRTGGTTGFTGTITSTGTGIGIAVGSNTGGTVNLSGSSKGITSGTANGVSLTSNTGTSINFTGGGLVISSTSGTGFNATGGATAISVTGSGNTINSTSATALNVSSTTIGASGLTFQSISSGNNSAAADPANGIVLNNTGTSGELTITGTGTAGTGGTIQNTTGHGISLNSTKTPSFSYLNVNGTGGDGINANSMISGFTLTSCQILNAGDGDNENGMTLLNVSGTVSIQGTTINNVAEEFIEVNVSDNSNLTMNVGTVTACTFTLPNTLAAIRAGGAFAGNAILVIPQGTSNYTLNVSNSTFTDIKGSGIQYGGGSTSTATNCNINVDNNDFLVTITNMSGNPNNRANNINIQARNTMDIDASITNNLLDGGGGGSIQFGADESSNLSAIITGNTVSDQFADGILAGVDENASMNLQIDNNNISNTSSDGMEIANAIGPDGKAATLIATITNNVVTTHNTNVGGNAFAGGIGVYGGVEAADVTFVNVTGNSVSGAMTGAADYYLQDFGDPISLQGPGTAAVMEADFLAAPPPQNTAGSGFKTFITGTFYSNGATVPLPVLTP